MRALVGIGLFALASSVLADPRDFSIEVRPVFESTFNWAGAPIAIEIENRGPDVTGSVYSSDVDDSTRYPVELPTGSKKRIVTFSGQNPYGTTPEFILQTNRDRMRIPFLSKSIYSYGNMSVVAVISDVSGELAFMRRLDDGRESQQNAVFGDAYCTPESAPDRPVGYSGLGAVVLSSGSERLSDASVKALKTFAMTGGTLIFVGGASAAVLADPRWRGTLPAIEYHTKTIAGSQVLSELSGQPINESITVAAGKPIAAARSKMERGIPMICECGFGLGRIVVFAFNPFEDPLVRWQGRRRLFMQQVRDVDYLRSSQFIGQFLGQSYDPYSAYPGSTSYSYYGSPSTGPSDPFSIKLPGTSKVFWILALFFVVVVPVNFLVLRKLGRGELAWVTAPVISLAFAMVFLNQAGDLYSASLSTATNGAVIVHEGAPEAMFVGTTQIFFPNGGSYDLKMEDIDQLGSTYNEYGYYERDSARSQMNPVDVGTIKIPDLRAANLAFEEIAYHQRMPNNLRIQVKTTRLDNNRFRVSVRNGTTSQLRNAALIVRGVRYPLKELAPGAEQSMEPNMTVPNANPQSDPLNGITRNQNIAIVVADFGQGMRPGPQIGAEVAARTNIRIVYVAPLPIGGELK